MLAPVGCLQYYTSASGVVQSFNYKEEVTFRVGLDLFFFLMDAGYPAFSGRISNIRSDDPAQP